MLTLTDVMLKMQCDCILCNLNFQQVFSLLSSLFVSFHLPLPLILYFTDEYFRVGCLSFPTPGLRFCIHVFTIPYLSVAAFAGVHCAAKVLAQHPRECHPFSVPIDQDLLKLSHLGSSTRNVKQRAESIPLQSVCVVVRAGSSCRAACQRQDLRCSSSTSLPSSEVSAAAEIDSRAALAAKSSEDRLYPPLPFC